jgi:GT2 family glycosyltransferase
MKLSIVIVNWNTGKLLEKCLDSLFSNPPEVEFEVWVVDNASSDQSVSMVKSAFPRVNLIKNEENLGFAGANNQAIRRCTGEYVLLLNPDTEIRADALQVLVDFMERHPVAGGAGAKILNPDGTLQVSCYPAPTLSREFWRLFQLDRVRYYGIYDMAAWDPDRDREVDVIQGACLILRARALEEVGLLDVDYFMYTEEVDVCYRLRKARWKLIWVPGARVVHYGGQATQQVATEMFLELYRSKILYFTKHHGGLAANLYKSIVFAATLARLSVSPFALFEERRARDKHISLANNYRRLLSKLFSM